MIGKHFSNILKYGFVLSHRSITWPAVYQALMNLEAMQEDA
jgi:hypothetical protein